MVKLNSIKPRPPKKRTWLHKAETVLLIDLAKLRTDKGITLRDAAKACGLMTGTYYRIECGGTPSYRAAFKVAAFIDLPMEKIWKLAKS